MPESFQCNFGRRKHIFIPIPPRSYVNGFQNNFSIVVFGGEVHKEDRSYMHNQESRLVEGERRRRKVLDRPREDAKYLCECEDVYVCLSVCLCMCSFFGIENILRTYSSHSPPPPSLSISLPPIYLHIYFPSIVMVQSSTCL